MTHRQLKIAIALGVLFVAGLVGLFFVLFERVEEEEDVGYRGAARLNRFLAAERMFNRLGVTATSTFDSWDLPGPRDTLVLLNPQRVMSEEQGAEVLAWVAAGGNLVAVLPDAPSLDPLTVEFGIGSTNLFEALEEEEETEAEAEEEAEEEPAAEEAPPGEDGEPAQDGPSSGMLADVVGEMVEVPLQEPGAGKPFRVWAEGFRRMVPPESGPDGRPEVQAGTDDGTYLLRYAYENGQVTFLSDARFLTNGLLKELDHGPFAWALIQRRNGPPETVLLVVRDEVPSLFALIGRHAWMVVVSGAFLVLAWLRLAGSRLGPVLPDPPRDRRSLLEHVEATGDFLWRSGQAEELVQSTRQALVRRVEVRQPTWAKLSARDLVERLAGASGLAAPAVQQALHQPVQDDPAAFVSTIQTLETLRRSL
ncbi:MAG TPA: DUF4350 domain-containing protein [Thermoanaerobaculia bacterium]|nr:DUF4350 domain-containing protein [Thermoanaerobaculia bacterium]